MPYTPTPWKDRAVDKPLTYTLQTNADGTTTLIPAEGTISEVGTPLTAANLNNLERQYEQATLDSLPRTGGTLNGALEVTGNLTKNGKDVAVIEEFGLNTNGTFIRFTNGLQLCYIAIQPTDQAISGAYGSLFQGTRAWTFPASFLTGSLPTAQCSEFKWGTGAGWGAISGASTPTGTTLRGFDVSTRATGTVCYISAFAIGKWK